MSPSSPKPENHPKANCAWHELAVPLGSWLPESASTQEVDSSHRVRPALATYSHAISGQVSWYCTLITPWIYLVTWSLNLALKTCFWCWFCDFYLMPAWYPFLVKRRLKHPSHRWQIPGSWAKHIIVLWAEMCEVEKALRKVALRKVSIPKRGYGQEDSATQRGETEKKNSKQCPEKEQLWQHRKFKLKVEGWDGTSSFYQVPLRVRGCGKIVKGLKTHLREGTALPATASPALFKLLSQLPSSQSSPCLLSPIQE